MPHRVGVRMDLRILLPVLLAGSVGLLWAPTLATPPVVDLDKARDATGPVRVEGVVAAVRESGGRTHVLLREAPDRPVASTPADDPPGASGADDPPGRSGADGPPGRSGAPGSTNAATNGSSKSGPPGGPASVWLRVRGPPALSPGDRVRVTARVQGRLLVADGADVEVLVHGPAVLLRHVARAPWVHEGPVTLHATVDDVFRTVLYLKDGGHRLRVEPGQAAFPPDGARPGDRVWASGRLRYAADRVGYVLDLDDLRAAADPAAADA